jgi:hypothetical protein
VFYGYIKEEMMAKTYKPLTKEEIDKFMLLEKFDRVTVTADFVPQDGIDKEETVGGMFIMHAQNLPSGWIPFGYVVLENGATGWFHPASIELVIKHADLGEDVVEMKRAAIKAATAIQGEIKELTTMVDDLVTALSK